jgi:outer membrane lipoprotein-sorting protein
VSYFLRRLSLSHLLLLCATVVAVGIGATALAVALGTGPVPPPKPLAQAVHDALAAAPVQGVSARIQLTDHLIEGSSLESQGNAGSGGGAASNPLLTGATGRLWISSEGRIRIELQSEEGDTEILYDGHTITLYDAASNSLYRYTLPPGADVSQSSGAGGNTPGGEGSGEGNGDSSASAGGSEHKVPTVSEIQEAIVRIMRHANLSGAQPTDVAGQAAYAVRISPSHNGGLVGGAELAWDAIHGVPLRVAVYSTQSTAPVLELAATEVSYGAVPASVFELSPPANAKVTEVKPPTQPAGGAAADGRHAVAHEQGLAAVQAAVPFTLDAPATLAGMARGEVRGAQVNGHAAALIAYGEGLGGIAVLESAAKHDASAAGEAQAHATTTGASSGGSRSAEQSSEESSGASFLGDLPKVALPGASATELPTPLGTLLSFKRDGVDYLLAGSVTPATLQDAAKGL